MNAEDLKNKWLKIVKNANEKGVPLPMIRADGKASLSATFTFIAFNTWLISVMGKFAGFFGGVDSGQCFQMFIACAGLYWGRKFQSDGNKVELGGKESGNEEGK